MDTPRLSRIESHARVSRASRSDEARPANGAWAFSTLLLGEDAAGRRRSRHLPCEEPAPEGSLVWEQADALCLITAEFTDPLDGGDVLPEDAHDPQELCALLAVPPC